MAFTTSTSPTHSIIEQEGSFAFDFDLSGACFAGQAVESALATGFVRPVPAASVISHGCVGIAAYDQTDNNPVAVYGPGNIVRGIISGTSKCTIGDVLHACQEGKWVHKDSDPKVYISGICAVALQTQGTADGTALMLLF